MSKSGPQKWAPKTTPIFNLNSDSILGPIFGVHFLDHFWAPFLCPILAGPLQRITPGAGPAASQPATPEVTFGVAGFCPKLGPQKWDPKGNRI